MSEWKECRLGDVAVFQRGHDLPKKDMKEGTIPVAGSNGIIGYHNTATTKCPGVTIGRSGNIGTPKFYNGDFWAHNTVLYVKDFKGNDEKFVFYFLHTFDFSGFDAGSAVPTLNRNHIHEIPVVFPPFPEQRAIAVVLSSLDDKIDLMHRQNKTLEGMAEALWRKTFVEEADPRWDKKGLDEIATFLNGLPCQKYPPDTANEPLPVIKIRELRSGFTDDSDMATSALPPEYIINDGDILFSWSGSLKIIIWSFGKGVLNQHLFKVTSDNYPKWFYYYAIKQHLSEFRDIAQDKATTMGHIQRHHLTAAKVFIPDNVLFNEVNMQIDPLFNKITRNLKAIRKYAHLRDTLLPRLMSGEVRVKQ